MPQTNLQVLDQALETIEHVAKRTGLLGEPHISGIAVNFRLLRYIENGEDSQVKGPAFTASQRAFLNSFN